MHKTLLPFAVILMCLSSEYLLAAEKQSLATLHYDLGGTKAWVPYGYTGLEDKPGIFADIVESVMQQANIAYKPYFYPAKRAENELQTGMLDFDFISPSWFKDQDIGDDYVGSHGIFEVTEYFVTLASYNEHFNYPASIKKQVVGTVAGYFYYDDNLFIRADFLSESELMLGLKKGRFNVAILEDYAANYWSDFHQVPIKLVAVHTKGKIIIRLRKEHQKLLPQINGAIQLLLKTGRIEEIFKRYHLDMETKKMLAKIESLQ
jgi:hypothetical protein